MAAISCMVHPASARVGRLNAVRAPNSAAGRLHCSTHKNQLRSGGTEPLAGLRCQEYQVRTWRFDNDCDKRGVERNSSFSAGLVLAKVQDTVSCVLSAHSNNITAPLTSVEQQH